MMRRKLYTTAATIFVPHLRYAIYIVYQKLTQININLHTFLKKYDLYQKVVRYVGMPEK